MSQSELDQLLDQLFFDDPKIRRTAARRLGELGLPEAIADLVNVYNKDADPGVRKAAEDSLRKFRRIEQDIINGNDDEDGGSGGPDLGPILSKARIGLVVLLAITVFVNAAVLVGKAIPVPVPTTPTLAAPTDRAALVSDFTKRVDTLKDEATTLRQLMSGLQGLGMNGVDRDQCTKLEASTLNNVDLDSLDSSTYPDLRLVNDQINIPTLKIVTVRNTYRLICSTKVQAEFDKILADQGGADKVVARVDEVINKDLPAAQAGLQTAIDSPAPTVGPTATITPTFTPTVPTETPTAIPSVTPTLAPTEPGATEAATTVAGGIATEEPTTALQGTYTLTTLGIEKLASFRYRVTGSTSGVYPNNRTFRGSLSVLVQKQTGAKTSAQFDISINEGNPSNAFFKPYLPTLYAQGSSTFVLVDETLYETGDILKVDGFNGRCRVTLASPQTTARLQDFTFGNLSDFELAQLPGDAVVNGEKTVHYRGERPQGTSGELYQTLDVFVAVKSGIPVQITSVRTINPKADAATKAKSGLKDFNETLTYDLTAQDIAIDLIKPITCS